MARPNSKEDEQAIFSHKPKLPAVKYEGTIPITCEDQKRVKTDQLVPVAVHIATGRFVHFAGPVTNVHDARLFQEGPLPKMFDRLDEDGQLVTPRRGLADRGYFSTNPNSKLCQCLLTVIKKPRDRPLNNEENKLNQLRSTVRIEVERALGRLRNAQRLVIGFRSSRSALEQKTAQHRKIFNVCIHFTNYSMSVRPLRKEPHWLLGMGLIGPRRIRDLLRSFFDAPPGLHIKNLLHGEELNHFEDLVNVVDEDNDDDTE